MRAHVIIKIMTIGELGLQPLDDANLNTPAVVKMANMSIYEVLVPTKNPGDVLVFVPDVYGVLKYKDTVDVDRCWLEFISK